MQSHRSSLHVHALATACVFSLTTQDLAETMPVGLLSASVAQLLNTMKTFPNHQQVSHRRHLQAAFSPCIYPERSLFLLLPFQVQKNCLLALCSEHILQEVPFDK